MGEHARAEIHPNARTAQAVPAGARNQGQRTVNDPDGVMHRGVYADLSFRIGGMYEQKKERNEPCRSRAWA